MSRQYQYIKINNYYFVCLQQNPATLAWILYLKRYDLHSIFTPWRTKEVPCGIINCIRYFYGLFMSNLRMLILFMLYRYNLRDIESPIQLPIYGQLCLHVHKGYKVFNLRRGMVVKVFDFDINKEIMLAELKRLKSISQIDFAPSLKRWNVDERWYEEEYVSGYPLSSYKSMDFTNSLKLFNYEIIPCLRYLILFKQPTSINSIEYVNKIICILEVSRSTRPELDIQDVNKIRTFIYSFIERLTDFKSNHIYLVFSHGDFCAANILTTKNGIRILDWEGAAYRSALFDFYSYFFYRPACINLPVNKLVLELKDALPAFISKSALMPSENPETFFAVEHIYRWIFYIEFICKLVERDMTDKNLNIMDFIIRYIDAFNRYEEMVNN